MNQIFWFSDNFDSAFIFGFLFFVLGCLKENKSKGSLRHTFESTTKKSEKKLQTFVIFPQKNTCIERS